MTDFTYDIECLKNVWTCIARNKNTGRWFRFEISERRNDYSQYCDWLNRLATGNHRMVGFNNINYDYPMTHHMVVHLTHLGHKPKKLTKALYHKSKEIFKNGNSPFTKFAHVIWPNDCLVEQIDLFKIHHFDNKARMTSLKRLQFNMRLPNIVEFELDFNKKLKVKHIDGLMDYNENDVTSTESFLDMTQKHIKLRQDMTDKHDKNFMNHNDTKIGEDYLVMQLREKVGDHILKDEDGNKRKTKRSMIPIEDFIFPYVKFDHPELKKVLKRLRKMYIFVIGSKFHWNQNTNYLKGMVLLKASKSALAQIRKEFKAKRCEQPVVDKAIELYEELLALYSDHHITGDVGGFEFVFGKGGLHGTLRKTVMRTTKSHVIMDLDVKSYYPKVGIENGLYPQHLTSAFCPVYEEIYQMREQFPKGTMENAVFKLALNGGGYGKTNSIYSVLYDPLYMITTTINGQLMLCMLWDKLRTIPGVSIIQANTDGITIYMPRTKKCRKLVSKVCKKWQKTTKLELEQAVYKNMWIRDGNNYIAEYAKGGLKSKGDYMYNGLYHDRNQDPSEIDQWHKNHSMIIVQKAVEAELVHGIPARTFIIEHEDIYDFFLCTNVNRASTLVLNNPNKDTDKPIQRVSRYLVSSDSGRYLIKIMPPLPAKPNLYRRIAISKGYQVTIHNKVKSDKVSDYDINYDFYIAEAEKLIKPFRSSL